MERGLLEFQQAKSLLQAVRDADWVIEAIHEDLGAKQRLLESIEQPAEYVRANLNGHFNMLELARRAPPARGTQRRRRCQSLAPRCGLLSCPDRCVVQLPGPR